MRWYCTYCDRNYLSRMLVLADSLVRHEKQSHTLFVVCLDELTRILLTHLNRPEIFTIPLHQLEGHDGPLRVARDTRSLVEYYWTLTPTVLLGILEQHQQIDRLTYLDSDLFFFSSPETMFTENPEAATLIHGHNFAVKYRILEQFGRYNVGLLSFRRTEESFCILREWREQCLAWCYARPEEGKFGDQMYLNDWPERFSGVHVLQHPGVGIAPWNQNDLTFEKMSSGELLVSGAPLVFFHFHALEIFSADIYAPAKLLHYCFELPVLSLCYLPYVMALRQTIFRLQAILPAFECGIATRPGLTAHTLLSTLPAGRILATYLQGFSQTNLGDGWIIGRTPLPAPDPATLTA